MKAVPAALDPVASNQDTNEQAPESSARPGSFKKCGCGKTYSRSAWQHLPCIGRMRGRGESIELRQCSCTSTIAVLVA